MDVFVERGFHVGMTENFRQGFDVKSDFNTARREGVPKRMKIGFWQITF